MRSIIGACRSMAGRVGLGPASPSGPEEPSRDALNSLRLFSIVVVILSFGTVPAFAIDPAVDLRLAVGSGFDSSTLEARDDCVERNEEVLQGGPRVDYSLRVIENSSDLRKYLGISAEASLKASLGEMGGKAAFSDSLSINQYSLYALAATRVINSQTLLRDVKLKEDARDLYLNDIKKFQERCGDQFITGFQDGGEFIGLISIQATNAKQKRDIRTAISGSYGIFSASGSVKESTIATTNSYDQAVQVYRAGGESNKAEPETLKKLVEISTSFPARLDNPKTAVKISLLSRSYSTLNLPSRELKAFHASERRQVIEQLSALYDQARDIEANVNYVLENPDQFMGVNREALGSAIESAQSNKNTIQASARRCFSGEDCKLPNLLVLSAVELPQRRGDPVKAGARLCERLKASSNVDDPSKHLLDHQFMELATTMDVCDVLRAKEGIIHSRGPSGVSPLHVAAYSSRETSVIELLVEYGAHTDAWDINGRLPIHYALQYNENPNIARFLIAETKGKLPDTKEAPRAGFSQRPALHLAAENNNPAVARLLLSEYKQDVHKTDNDGTTALHVAAAVGTVKTVGVLIDNGARLNDRDKLGRTPLHVATMNGRKEVLDVLLRRGADSSLIDDAGNTVRHYAAMLLSGSNVHGFNSRDSNIAVWDTLPIYLNDPKNKKGETAFEVLSNRWAPLHHVLKRAPEMGTVTKGKLVSHGSWKQVIRALVAANMNIVRASECQGALLADLMERRFQGEKRIAEVELLEAVALIDDPYLDKLAKQLEDTSDQHVKISLDLHGRSLVEDARQRLKVTIDLMNEINMIVRQAEVVVGGLDFGSVGTQNRDQRKPVDGNDCRYKWDGEN